MLPLSLRSSGGRGPASTPRAARVYRQDGTETHLAENGALDGEDVLSGFACTLTSIL